MPNGKGFPEWNFWGDAKISVHLLVEKVVSPRLFDPMLSTGGFSTSTIFRPSSRRFIGVKISPPSDVSFTQSERAGGIQVVR